MFRKIRNKILLLNMLMASSVVIVVFAVIFISTYTRVQNENQMKLMFDSPVYRSSTISIGHSLPEIYDAQDLFMFVDRDQLTSVVLGSAPRRISPDAGMSFSIIVDSETNVLEIDSIVDFPPEIFTHVAASAMGDMSGMEIVNVEGRMWQFAVSPVTIINGTTFDPEFETTLVTSALPNDYSYIRFVDITDSHRMLQSLALTLTAATVIVLAVFFFISRYFAGQAVKPMEEAWEKQRRFIADASHELKTPLSVINANCGVLYANKDEPLDGQIKWVDSISRATGRMTGLVGSLLSLASMEDTRLPLQRSPFDLSGEIMAAIGEMEAVALEKGLNINKMIEPDMAIESDREQIRNILSSLLDNAVKYTPDGGEVTVSLRREKRNIVCAVRNSGAGIPAEELPFVFDRFYRGDPARSSGNGGYGLGLAIAKAIADQLGVKLSVECKEGEYTEFKLVFSC